MINVCAVCGTFLGEVEGKGISGGFCSHCLKVKGAEQGMDVDEVVRQAEHEEAKLERRWGTDVKIGRQVICEHLVSLERGMDILCYRCGIYGIPRCHLNMSDPRFLSSDEDCVSHCAEHQFMTVDEWNQENKKKGV